MKSSAFVLVLIGALAVPMPASAATQPAHFIALDAGELKAILPPPPAVGSLAALADLEAVLQMQAARTPNDVAWAKYIERDSFFQDASVIGSWFSKENLPVLTAFMKSLSEDLGSIGNVAKDIYPRARPPRTDATVHPCVEIPTTGSYPSGHSFRAFVWAMVLGDIFPDDRAALLAHAHQVAWGRVIGGVHFPSDTVGGRLLAEALVAQLRKNPAYQSAIEKCRAEAAPFLLKKAA